MKKLILGIVLLFGACGYEYNDSVAVTTVRYYDYGGAADAGVDRGADAGHRCDAGHDHRNCDRYDAH